MHKDKVDEMLANNISLYARRTKSTLKIKEDYFTSKFQIIHRGGTRYII